MGEIKSTLDLVLEKTKNLTLSSEEKEEQKQKEIEKHIKGMMQKYQDGVLTPEQLKNEYGLIKKDDNLTATRSLIKEIVGRLNFLKSNGLVLKVLGELGGFNTDGLQSLIDESRGTYRNAAGKRSDALKNMLAANHSISGSAVVPNLAADEQWHREEREIRSKFEDSLVQVETRLLDKAQRAKSGAHKAGRRGQRAEGRGQRAEGTGQRAEGTGQRAEGTGQT